MPPIPRTLIHSHPNSQMVTAMARGLHNYFTQSATFSKLNLSFVVHSSGGISDLYVESNKPHSDALIARVEALAKRYEKTLIPFFIVEGWEQ